MDKLKKPVLYPHDLTIDLAIRLLKAKNGTLETHGLRSKEMLAESKQLREFMKVCKEAING